MIVLSVQCVCVCCTCAGDISRLLSLSPLSLVMSLALRSPCLPRPLSDKTGQSTALVSVSVCSGSGLCDCVHWNLCLNLLKLSMCDKQNE